ncbi:MAG: hypothetical protein EA426_14905 [Spirochaetaceae bacterium]|nr:MAG: hypothetical protein EA426_14905 [Spirochaetaceae bacterium]
MRTPLHPARAFLSRFGRMHVILPVSVLNSAAEPWGVDLGNYNALPVDFSDHPTGRFFKIEEITQ